MSLFTPRIMAQSMVNLKALRDGKYIKKFDQQTKETFFFHDINIILQNIYIFLINKAVFKPYLWNVEPKRQE